MTEENDRRLAESSRIGAEGGRISAETGRVTADTARTDEDKKRHDSRVRKDIGQLMAYVLIIVVAAAGFWQMDQQQQQICSTAKENRDGIKSLVTAVELLGRNLITEGKPESKWSPGEKAAMANLAEFKKAQFDLLEAPVC